MTVISQLNITQEREEELLMFKSIITLAVALSLATPALGQDFPSRSQRAAAAAQGGQQSTATPIVGQPTMTFRHGPSPEQVAQATEFRRRIFRACQSDNLRAENQRVLAEGLGNIAGIVVEKVLDRRSYGFRSSSRGYGNRDSSQQCEQVAQQAYNDMLTAVPTSFCERSMTTRRTRGGQPLEPEVATENCQSSSPDNWDGAFRPVASNK
jgi:hypothetical protein